MSPLNNFPWQAHIGETKKSLTDMRADRGELEKRVDSMTHQIHLPSGGSPSTDRLTRGGSLVRPRRTAGTTSTTAAAPSSDLPDGWTVVEGEDGATTSTDPVNPLGALVALSNEARANSPKASPARTPKQPTAPEPIIRLRKAVDDIREHFSHMNANNRSVFFLIFFWMVLVVFLIPGPKPQPMHRFDTLSPLFCSLWFPVIAASC